MTIIKSIFTGREHQQGFTLVELVVVMSILLILVSIAVMIFRDVSRGPANECHNANVRILVGAAYMAIAEHGLENFNLDDEETPIWTEDPEDPENANNPCWSAYLQEWPEVPKDSDAYGGEEDQGEEYKVFLTSSGSVTVKPGMVEW